jgi:uncharacterized protein YggE
MRKKRNGLILTGTLGTALLIATGLATPVLAQPQLSGTPDELRGFLYPRANTVNISGEAELNAYKDIARVSLLVTTEARDLNQAMSLNQELRGDLITQFTAAGIPAADINNSRFASSPQYGLFGRNPSSYEVSARLDVEVSSEEALQLLAGAADEYDEVEFERVEFEHSEEEAFEDEVRELALQDVMEQKAFYEDTLGLELRAINFFYGGIRQMARAMPATLAMEEMAMDAVGGRSTAAVSAAPAVAPSFDEVEYQTSVTVVFEIVSENQTQN